MLLVRALGEDEFLTNRSSESNDGTLGEVNLSLEVLIAILVTSAICGVIFCVGWACHRCTSSNNNTNQVKVNSNRSFTETRNRFTLSQESDNEDSESYSEDTVFLKKTRKFISDNYGLESDKKVDEVWSDHNFFGENINYPISPLSQRICPVQSRHTSKSWHNSQKSARSSVLMENMSLKFDRSRSPRETQFRETSAPRTPRGNQPSSNRDCLPMDYPIVESTYLDFIETIASGSFGVVNKMAWRREGYKTITVAVKLIENEKIWQDESKLLDIPPHKNIVKFLGLIQHKGQFGIVMPYYELGNLKDILYGKRELRHELEPFTKWLLMIDIARGIEHLHKHKIIHRDIASRNVLIEQVSQKEELSALVSDFGFARTLQYKHTQQTTNESFGPVKWMAPEALKGKYSEKSDVYSFGMTCYEMLEHMEPFSDMSNLMTRDCILHGDRPRFRRQSTNNAVLPGVLNVIRKCWLESPSARPSMSEIARMLSEVKVSQVYHPFYGRECANSLSISRAEEVGLYHDESTDSQQRIFRPSTVDQMFTRFSTTDDGEIDQEDAVSTDHDEFRCMSDYDHTRR